MKLADETGEGDEGALSVLPTVRRLSAACIQRLFSVHKQVASVDWVDPGIQVLSDTSW